MVGDDYEADVVGAKANGVFAVGVLWGYGSRQELLAAGAMIGGLTDHYFFNLKFPHSVVLFWMYVGLGAVAVRLGAPRVDDRP